MKKSQANFLQQFNSNIRTHIINFAERLTQISQEVDIMIFLARKAACMGDCFYKLGLSKFHCDVTSSRILDLNLSWLRGKRVAIVDDMLISGTTIHKVVEKLRQNDIHNVKVYVLSTDTDFFNPNVLKIEEPYLRLDNKHTTCACAEIVKAISSTPRPYTIDYPLFREVNIREEIFGSVHSIPGWVTFNTTSNWLLKNGILNLTIEPDAETRKIFLNRLGIESESEFLFKIRLYAIKDNACYRVSLQPIAILPELSIEKLTELFSKVNRHFVSSDFSLWNNGTSDTDRNESRLRLIQYVIAGQLAMLWKSNYEFYSKKHLQLKQCNDNLRLIFPKELHVDIKYISESDILNFENIEIPIANSLPSPTQNNFKHANILKVDQKDNNPCFDDIIAAYKLTIPFINKYKKEEIKARFIVKNKGLGAFRDEKYKSILNRLNRGISLDELKDKISDYKDVVNLTHIVSNFLDIYIDRGSVVPITHISGNTIYRAFRHGEDVQFSQEELNLFAFMLHYTRGKMTCIKKTYLEKLLVLFARIGLQEDYLKLSQGGDSVGMHYYLHGAILQQTSDKQEKYIYNRSASVRAMLEKSNYIKYDKKLDGYITYQPKDEGMGIKHKMDAEIFANVMHELICSGSPKILSSKDFAFLASCPNVIGVIGALAGELYIFSTEFYSIQSKYFCNDYSKMDLQYFSKIRLEKSYTAINSATWKYSLYKRNYYIELIKRVSKFLENNAPIYNSLWKKYFPKPLSSEAALNREIIDLVNELASLLYFIRVCINFVELILCENWEEYVMSKSYNEVQTILSDLKEFIPNDGCITFVNNVLKKAKDNTLDKPGLYNYIHVHLANLKKGEHFDYLLTMAHVITSNYYLINKVETFRCFLYINWWKCSSDAARVICERIAEHSKDALAYIPERQVKHPQDTSTGMWLCFTAEKTDNISRLIRDLSSDCLPAHVNICFSVFLKVQKMILMRNAYSSDFKSPLFWKIAELLAVAAPTMNAKHEVHIFSNNTETGVNEMKKRLIESLTSQFAIKSKNAKREFEILPYKYNIEETVMNTNDSSPNEHQCDIGIICIKANELAGIKDVLCNTIPIQIASCQRKFWHEWLSNEKGEQLSVVVTRTLNQGNQSIVAAYHDLVKNFSPQYIALIGIAGSLSDKVHIGDVVIAENVLDYAPCAETSAGIEHRPKMYSSSAKIRVMIQNLQDKIGKDDMIFSMIDSNNRTTRDFTCYLADIASGETVLKFRDGETRKYISRVSKKLYAVETEAAGLSSAFLEGELSLEAKPKGFFIIRGISDHSDQGKSDDYQQLATRHAMHVLKELCATNDISPCNKTARATSGYIDL